MTTEEFQFNEGDDLVRRYRQYKQIDGDAAFRRFERRVGASARRPRGRFWLWIAGAAAAVVGIVFLASRLVAPSPKEGINLVAKIAPGGSKAYLTIGDGEQTALTGSATCIADIVPPQSSDTEATTGAPAPMMRVDVPRGGEYRLTLDDGTNVHLNAGSSLSFPKVFTGASRSVRLVGEAYFEVAHRDDCPFIVEVSGVRVRQYGTRFNIEAYGGQPARVTLVEGSIGVAAAGKGEHRLSPGCQAVVDGKGDVSISHVDIRAAMGWTTGSLVFDNKPLGDITQTLSRWYDVDISLSPSLRDTRFTGSLSRRGNLADILDAIAEITGMTYSYDGKVVTCQ